MDLDGKVCVVTGAAGGIGNAIAVRFAASGARVVVVDRPGTDLDGSLGLALHGDVTDPATHDRAIAAAQQDLGPVDLYCSNAGVLGSTIDDLDRWDALWQVNVLAHVLAARAVLPSMLQRKSGWLLQTASAAGLLVNLGDPAYTATKHAAVGFAEWLSATYRHQGIGVSCLCPMGVETAMLSTASESTTGAVVVGAGTVLTPDAVASCVVDALRDERFLILPHPEVSTFLAGKVSDIDAWLAAMNRVQQKLEAV